MIIKIFDLERKVIHLNCGTELRDHDGDDEVPDEGPAALAADLLLVEGGEDDGVAQLPPPRPGHQPRGLQQRRHAAPVIVHTGAGRHRVPVGAHHHYTCAIIHTNISE